MTHPDSSLECLQISHTDTVLHIMHVAYTPVNDYVNHNFDLIKLWQMGSVDKQTFFIKCQ